MKNKQYLLVCLFFTLFLFVDQLSKVLILNFQQYLPIPVLPAFNLTFVKNYGIAFGFQLPQFLLFLLIFLLIIFINYLFIVKGHIRKPLTQIIFALLLAGAIGNLIDRLLYGFVVDFISIGTFPVFNFADSYITTSVFLLLLFYDKIIRSKPSGKQSN